MDEFRTDLVKHIADFETKERAFSGWIYLYDNLRNKII